MQETLVRSLDREDDPEEEMATYSSILAWKIPRIEEPGGLQSIQLQRVRYNWAIKFSSVQLLSHVQLFVIPMDRSTPVLPVYHQLLESIQIHVHWVSDAIQPFHPLSCPSLPTLNLFQHQGLFKWVSSLHHVAKVLEFQLQHHFFQWTLRKSPMTFFTELSHRIHMMSYI